MRQLLWEVPCKLLRAVLPKIQQMLTFFSLTFNMRKAKGVNTHYNSTKATMQGHRLMLPELTLSMVKPRETLSCCLSLGNST